MKPKYRGDLEFPANPFVALADFLFVVMIVLILAVVHQSVATNKAVERLAVDAHQKHMRDSFWSPNDKVCRSSVLRDAYNKGIFGEIYRDGDLQRFWFDPRLFYTERSSVVPTSRGMQLIDEFGRVLAASQGNPSDPKSRPYKRVIIEGHADKYEGSVDVVWGLSIARANRAVIRLHTITGLSPNLLEASGRGAWEPQLGKLTDGRPVPQGQMNRRIEIVLVYAGPQSVDYINRKVIP